jgi:hypothetical protein
MVVSHPLARHDSGRQLARVARHDDALRALGEGHQSSGLCRLPYVVSATE